MQQPRRRILLPVLLALCLGWPAMWLVGKVLEPKPVFEVPLAPGYSAMIYEGSLHVSSMIDWNSYLYDLSSGTRLTLPDGKFNTVEDTPEPAITKPSQKIAITDTEPPYYFNFSHERDLKERNRYIYFDPIKGLSYRFHGYLEDDKYDEVIGNMNRRSRYCLLRRRLPFDVLLCNGLTPHDSPASLLLGQVAKATPYSCPTLHTIVTIPEKRIVSQFVLEGGWVNAQTSLSPNGRFVACIRNDTLITKEALEGLKLSCFWDVQHERWLTHLPDVSRRAEDWGLTFFNNQIFVGQFQHPTTLLESDTLNLLDIVTGQFLDHLQGITAYYFATKQALRDPEGTWWYLKRINRDQPGMTYQLNRTSDSRTHEAIGQHTWNINPAGVALTQGLQSIIPNDGQTPLVQYIQTKLGNSAFYKAVEPWLIRRSTSIYDWKTGQTWPGWTDAHRWYLSRNGEYLAVVFGKWDNNQLVEQHLAQVYRMPLFFFSPWWSRITGIVTAVLFSVLFWRWQSKRLPKPNA